MSEKSPQSVGEASSSSRQRASRQTMENTSGDDIVVDLRSDVLTQLTPAMRQAMYEGTSGDDVFGEDPTVIALQKRMAEMFGMEAALLVPSGTMGNLICVMCHCNGRGLEALLGDKAHIILFEQGGIAVLGGVMPRTMPQLPDGTFDLEKLDGYIRRDDPHFPRTALICVENTHARCGGKVLPLDWLRQLKQKAEGFGVPVHMDGARVMNAAVALDVPLKEILQQVDSVSLCLSKGIGAPIGTVIGGSVEFIASAVRLRKLLGGGWRQPGPLANAAMVALDDAVPRLRTDHNNAKRIAKAIKEDGRGIVHVDLEEVHTNIVLFTIQKAGLTAHQFCDRLSKVTDEEEAQLGQRVVVRSLFVNNSVARFVLHSSVTDEHLQAALRKIHYVLTEIAQQ